MVVLRNIESNNRISDQRQKVRRFKNPTTSVKPKMTFQSPVEKMYHQISFHSSWMSELVFKTVSWRKENFSTTRTVCEKESPFHFLCHVTTILADSLKGAEYAKPKEIPLKDKLTVNRRKRKNCEDDSVHENRILLEIN
ncbi:hypothetical protein JTB14_002646 [Gonioctena quinquepunctata]|nr:hypothetical protein JTB14_002646 [Gonioctena quinquepunctata]